MTDNKTVLITGANKGIGYEAARRLGELSYSVWLGCRDSGRGEQAAAKLREAGITAQVLEIDVSSDESVAKAAAMLTSAIDRLDALVNNAGIVLDRGKPTETALASVIATYETNVFGPIRTTQALLPLLRRSSAPRIVNVSSSVGSMAMFTDASLPHYNSNYLGYSTSKTALNAVTAAFAKELGAEGMKVNIADPGYTATDLNGFAGLQTVEQAAEIVVELTTLGEDGPNCGFFNKDGALPW